MSMRQREYGHSDRRAWLAKGLRMEGEMARFDLIWDKLEERGITEEWEREATSDEDVLDDARELRDYGLAWESRSTLPKRARSPRPPLRDIPVEPTEREREMSDALRGYFAAHAARRLLVQKFRREELPEGQLLTRDDEISEYLKAELQIESGVEEYLEKQAESPREDLPTEVPFAFGSTPTEGDDPLFMTHDDVADELADIEMDEETRMQVDWHGPAGWLLNMLGGWLVQKYPWRSVEEAVVFLISGRPPRLVEPLGASHNWQNATFSITYLPWISEETVVRAYRLTQRWSNNGRPTRRELPGDKTISVLRFVTERTNQDGRLPSWSELLRLWNLANPNATFADRSALRRAYRRSVEALVPPHLPLT